MLLSAPGLARYFLHRALLSDEVSWRRWLEKHQKALLRVDAKQGLVVQWLKWGANSLMIERLILAGCRVEETIKQPNPWRYLFQQIRQQSRNLTQTYYPSNHSVSELEQTFEQLETLSRLHLDAQGLALTSQTLLFHLQRHSDYGEKKFQQIKLIKRFSMMLKSQIDPVGFIKATELCPSLVSTLDDCLLYSETRDFQETFESYASDYQAFVLIRQTFLVYQNQYALNKAIPQVHLSTHPPLEKSEVNPGFRKASRL